MCCARTLSLPMGNGDERTGRWTDIFFKTLLFCFWSAYDLNPALSQTCFIGGPFPSNINKIRKILIEMS